MFSKLFGRKSPPPEDLKPGPQLGMLALKSLEGLTPDRIAAAWAKLFPTLSALAPVPLKPGEKEGGVYGFTLDGLSLMLATMRMPIPAGDIDYACKMSWMWPEAAEAFKNQHAHAIALCTPSGSATTDALALSRLLCAAAGAGKPVGIYWGSGGLVHKPKFFYDAVKEDRGDGYLPTMLWVGLAISADSNEGPYTLTSHGLRPFGHMEFEILDTHMPIGDLRMNVYNVANYLLMSGPVLKHGHTFGNSETERFKVEHTTSKFRKGERVMRLYIP
jgi:hypothetical protein